MLDAEFLNLLACPKCRCPVEFALDTLVARLNDEIRQGRLKNSAGSSVMQEFDKGLICRNSTCLYPVRGEVPLMLIDESISIS